MAHGQGVARACRWRPRLSVLVTAGLAQRLARTHPLLRLAGHGHGLARGSGQGSYRLRLNVSPHLVVVLLAGSLDPTLGLVRHHTHGQGSSRHHRSPTTVLLLAGAVVRAASRSTLRACVGMGGLGLQCSGSRALLGQHRGDLRRSSWAAAAWLMARRDLAVGSCIGLGLRC